MINKPTHFTPYPAIYYNQTLKNTLITGATRDSLSLANGTLTLAMCTNCTANINISNLITPAAFTYKGTEQTTTLSTKQASISTVTIIGDTGCSSVFSAGTLTLGMPTNYAVSMSLSILLHQKVFHIKEQNYLHF